MNHVWQRIPALLAILCIVALALSGAPLRSWYEKVFLDKSFWQQVAALVVGIPIGFGVSMGVNHYWQKWSVEPRENAARRQRQRTLIRVLTDNLHRNKGLVERVIEELEKSVIPTFNVDLTLLDSTAQLKFEVLENLELCQALDELRYELDHTHRQIDIWIDVAFSGSRTKSAFQTIEPAIRAAIALRLPGDKSRIISLVTKLNDESERLKTTFLQR
jgi:hypothetical protein